MFLLIFKVPIRQEWCNSNFYIHLPAACTKGMVHLDGGPTPAQGTVGVCIKNKWGQVCDTYWTDADAKVVCGQLGYAGKEHEHCSNFDDCMYCHCYT